MSFMDRAQTWFRLKVFEPVQEWLKSGAEPKILARSAAIGFSLGLCPLMGVSTMLCLGMLGLAKILKVEIHAAMALLANMLAIPVELSLIVMHMRVGEFLLRAPHLEVVHIRLSDLWKGDLASDLLYGVAHAIFGWLVLLPLETLLVNFATLPLFNFLKQKFDPYPHERLVDDDGGSSSDELELGHIPKAAQRVQAQHQRRHSLPMSPIVESPPVISLSSLLPEESPTAGEASAAAGGHHARGTSMGRASSSVSESLL